MPDLKELFTHMEQRILAIRNMEQSARHYGQASGKGHTCKSSKTATAEANRYHPYDRERKAATHDKAKNSFTRGDGQKKTTAPECQMCGKDIHHFLWQCDAFKRLNSVQQEEQLAKWGVCKICLTAKHLPEQCTKGQCPICQKERHNSLICPERQKAKVNQKISGMQKHRRSGQNE